MPQVSVRDSRRSPEDRRWIEEHYREYLNDLAPSATGLFPALGEIGHRVPDQLMRWYADSSAHALAILYGEERVGFAMVDRRLRPGTGGPGEPEYSMAEFFVARAWRRRGIGGEAVRLILDRFAGHWLITEHSRNAAAVTFWRRVVSAYTDGRYQERVFNGEVHQRFESAPKRPR